MQYLHSLKKLFVYFTFLGSVIMLFSANCVQAQSFRLDVPDEGWRMFPDTAAAWKNDDIFLPDEVNLAQLPVNPPTGGWNVLNAQTGIQVTLPATVEQYYWGAFGLKPYNGEYYFEDDDPQMLNGAYKGVSWWWREIDIPNEYAGKTIILNIRGARLRAEVYLNGKLVGYNILNEVSFESDLTSAILPGEKNILAIRITNPGGRLDWLDTQVLQWGNKSFPKSHGFGGIDRGMVISAHDPVYLSDTWILNTPEMKDVSAKGELRNTTSERISAKVTFTLKDGGKTIPAGETEITVEPGKTAPFEKRISHKDASVWNTDNPNLYTLRYSVSVEGKGWKDEAEKRFGFRWFAPDGIGTNALLRLNGDRIRLISAISWGFWGLNGLFPTTEFAKKEVLAAKTFGMNCIQFHRNPGKTEVLDFQDELGLMRYMEPGGGLIALGEKYTLDANSPTGPIDASGNNGEPVTFAERYMEAKILRMMKDQRTHPSLVIYAIQNEINPDLKNARIFNLIRKMQKTDPSRVIILKSGIPVINQVWVAPYDTTVYYDDGTAFSGYFDEHTVGGPGVWRDAHYVNKTNLTHYSDNNREVVAWGEMLGAAVPDNYPLRIKQLNKLGGKSYDLQDNIESLSAIDAFLDKWGFRKAFPNTEDYMINVGNKMYDFWGRIIETSRLAEANDFLVISGWESTAIENHSGLVDNMRNFKGDPSLISKRLALRRPVVKPRAQTYIMGDRIAVDLFVSNETNDPISGSFTCTLIAPSGNETKLGSFPIPAYKKDTFVYLLADSVVSPALTEEGEYTIRLQSDLEPKLTWDEKILSVNTEYKSNELPKLVGVYCENSDILKGLSKEFPGTTFEPYDPAKDYKIIAVASKLMYGWRSEVDSTRQIANTEDDPLFITESWGFKDNLEYVFSNLPDKKATVTLRFAEITLQGPGDRIFDVAINGKTVLEQFDIAKEAGGINIAIDKVFEVDCPDGIVKITIPELHTNYAKFNAIKVTSGNKVFAINCGGEQYTDASGLTWKKYEYPVALNDVLLAKVRNGANLLLIADGQEASGAFAKILGDAGAFTYLGHVGNVRASWMGSWLFVRDNPFFAGLPVDRTMYEYYQTPVSGADGIMLDGKDVEVFVGFGRDHDRNLGAAFFTAKLGKGTVVFSTLPGQISALTTKLSGIHPVVFKRILNNTLRMLAK